MRCVNSSRLGAVLALAIVGAFAVGLVAVAVVLPNPPDGPTPASTRMAYYAVFAACAVTLAAVPLVVWLADRRAGTRPSLAWRLVTVAGVTLAMLAVAWGVQTWADPPHNLRQCFTDYRSGGDRGHICEAGLVNRGLGLRRLDQGLAGAFVVLAATALLAARLALPPAGPRGVEISSPAATR